MINSVLLVALFISFIAFVTTIIVHFRLIKQYEDVREHEKDERIKMTEFYDVLVRWMMLQQKQKHLSNWFKENKYSKVAVYGMREIGILLYEELIKEGIDVVCAIDRNAQSLNINIEVLKPSDNLPDMDVIVVTAPHYFEQIKNSLKDYTDADVVSIEDVIFES